jgi:hypothetical protein
LNEVRRGGKGKRLKELDDQERKREDTRLKDL